MSRTISTGGAGGGGGSASSVDIHDGVDTGIKATVKDYTSSNPVTVVTVDTNGDYIAPGGGGTQYDQGTASTDTDKLTMAGAVRRDTAAVATGVADGDRLAPSTDALGRLRVTSVDLTQPVSAASLPLPTGAATAAKQPALGTAGTASADVISVQGIASMTPVQVSQATAANLNATVVQGTAANLKSEITIAAAQTLATVTTVATVSAVTAVGTITPGTAASSLGKAEDAVHASGDVGVMALAVRQDAAGAFGADGDYAPLQLDSVGALKVTGGGGGTQYSQGTATTDTDVVTMAGAVRRDTAAVATGVADGDRLAPSTDSVGRLRVTSVDTTQPVSAASLPLPTGASTAAKQPALGTAGTASTDVISVQGIASMTPLLVTPTTNAAVNVAQINGVTPLMGNGATGTGALRVSIANDSTGIVALTTSSASIGKLAANSGVDIGDVDVTTLPAVTIAAAQTLATVTTVSTVTAVTTLTGSGVAHDAADSGNPHKIGGRAIASSVGQTIVAANDRTDGLWDLDGTQLGGRVVAYGDLLSERASNTDGASTVLSTFGATASQRNMLTAVTVHNAHATTNGYVDIRDGAAGAVLWTFPLPATGGATHNFNPPLRQPTQNTALAFDVSAAITTVYLSFNGFKTKL